MVMAGLLLLIYLALITPVKLGAAVSVGEGPPGAAVGVMLWGWKRVLQIHVRREAGVPRLCAEMRGRSVRLPPAMDQGWVDKAVKAMLRALTCRQGARRILTLCVLDGVIRIGGEDAARVALLTGSVRAALDWLPMAEVRCVPAFGGASLVRLRCIARARLGTIWAAGLRTALSMRRRGRKEEGAWINPSGN